MDDRGLSRALSGQFSAPENSRKICARAASAEAGPLMCGGITVFAPLALYAKPTDRVGVIGVGGLGHMAVKFAAAYGCDVTAFTSSPSKFNEAKGFGANHVVSSKDSAAIKELAGRFDLLINTVNATLDWDAMIGALAPNGRVPCHWGICCLPRYRAEQIGHFSYSGGVRARKAERRDPPSESLAGMRTASVHVPSSCVTCFTRLCGEWIYNPTQISGYFFSLAHAQC